MSQVTTRFGYGKSGTVEADEFTRILNLQFYDTEEVRFIKPPSLYNNFEYCGVAIAGSNTYDPVWTCIRKSYDVNSKGTRLQIRFNVIWDNVVQGWN